MASGHFPDVFTWIQNIPPITKWPSSSLSIYICLSASSHPPLKFVAEKSPIPNPKTLSFSMVVDSNLPLYLWSSNQPKIDPKSTNPFDEQTITSLMINLIEAVLGYASNKTNATIKIPRSNLNPELKDIFNVVSLYRFLSVSTKLQWLFVSTLWTSSRTIWSLLILRHASTSFMKLLGSNLEEQWMRSMNLAITNWFLELKAATHSPRTSSPSFSYAVSAFGLWKVHLYCPLVAMEVNYKFVDTEKWINVNVKIDNIRYDVIRLASERLMAKGEAGEHEKHFPSRISLQLTPTLQTDIISVSVSKSSNNPQREFEVETSIEGTFDPPNSLMGIRVAGKEATTMSMKPWMFEQSVLGSTANLNWLLYDTSMRGREVFSSKPSRVSMINPRSWFKDQYARANRSFTGRGGVIFAGDEYGKSVVWKVGRGAKGKTMEWEIKGYIWLTYCPNKYKTFYHETRRLEFTQALHLNIA